MATSSSLKRQSIFALTLYMVFVVTIVGTVSYLVMEPPIREQLIRNLDTRSKIISSEIEASLESPLGVLQSIVSIGNTGEAPELQADILRNLFSLIDGAAVSGGLWPKADLNDENSPYKSQFFNRAEDGAIDRIYSWDNPATGGYDGEPWYTDVVNKPLGTVAWSSVYIDPFTHVQMITASSPYYVDNQFAGVATVDLSLESLVEFIKLNSKQYDLGILIRDSEGEVVIEYNFKVVEGIYISEHQFGDFGWTIDVVNADRLVADQTYDLVTKVEMGIVPIMLLCVLVGYVVINRSLIDPISQIAREVDDSKHGGLINLDYKNDDEIKHLIDVFNQKTVFLEQEKKKALASMHAKSAFLATISHEVRTPMNGVLGTAQILLKTDLTHEQRKHLKTLYDSGDHMMMLLNEILDFSKIEQGHLELEKAPFPLQSIIGSINSVYHTLCAEKGLKFEIENNVNNLRWYTSDKARLRQILFNLLNNAVKFTSQGFVKISFDEIEMDGRNCLNIKVTDSGVGIDKSALEKIFRPFVQAESSTTRRFGGTGLGLAIVKQISELMDGDVSVQSELGKGTTFDVLLEMEVCEPKQAENSEHRKLNYKGLKALIVEDNRTNTIIIKSFMSAKGFECHCVADGEQAVEAVQASQFDLILMDNHMPVKDGITATQEIRALRTSVANTLIFGCTADLFKETQERMRAAGVDGIVSKPIDEKELDDMLYRHSDKLYQYKSLQDLQSAAPFNAEEQLVSLYIAVEDQKPDEAHQILTNIYRYFNHDAESDAGALLAPLVKDKQLPSQQELDVLTVLLKDA
ncbi:response regulator [Vibrio ponticus]|uniref:histidine kinase n=1 Tax=Vibrio ponticus TaxID=265668 RepID=A0A3N3E752_9VIBR|nr:hybrid sensor histidine kinase/response regulator [Vibrio ponticus]ROV62512.1 response regulator [Vibrio ponticus]ROV62555.1 response regulator [Vibrio ponticus]